MYIGSCGGYGRAPNASKSIRISIAGRIVSAMSRTITGWPEPDVDRTAKGGGRHAAHGVGHVSSTCKILPHLFVRPVSVAISPRNKQPITCGTSRVGVPRTGRTDKRTASKQTPCSRSGANPSSAMYKASLLAEVQMTRRVALGFAERSQVSVIFKAGAARH